ncbi:MAG TPA: penicillin-binding transpeptidase domain-containing protein, partial [Thermoanaerobaculia bacterium]|nr:penicillin-binding transpeptidase domain-containing protein [Thermoanaerobaculia bacterium]
ALLARRNRLLGRMADLGWIGRDQARRTQAEPLGTAARQLAARPCAPWFADLAAQEARQRFGVADLAGGGYLLFSTLDAGEQRRAEAALTAELADLGDRQRQGRAGARRPEPAPPGRRSRQEGPEQEQPGQEQPGQEQRGLEAALVSVDPRDGGILAYVGGRDYRQSQFDRLAQAHRQLGSAFKPVVYAAAFDLGVATPATLLDDSPVLVRTGGAFWEPQNYDRTFRGWVTARGALEQSLNVPTVRLALEVGLRRIANLAGAMGLGTPPAAVPAMALGAVEASPLQVARMYSTLATLGLRPTLHGLDTVRDRNGILLAGEELPPPRRVLAAPTAYLVTSLLQGAVDHGTASAVRRQGLADPVAGKTGTTSDRRDSWFAGYSADRVTVVWLGYDDDSGTRLSGATAAVPLWGRFMLAVRPAGGFHGFAPPPGMLDDGTATGTDLGAVAPAGLQLPAGTRAWTQGAPGAVPASASGLPPGLSAGGEHGGVILIRLHEAVDPDRKGGAP